MITYNAELIIGLAAAKTYEQGSKKLALESHPTSFQLNNVLSHF